MSVASIYGHLHANIIKRHQTIFQPCSGALGVGGRGAAGVVALVRRDRCRPRVRGRCAAATRRGPGRSGGHSRPGRARPGWRSASCSSCWSLVPGVVGRAAVRVADVVTPGLLRRAAGALLGRRPRGGPRSRCGRRGSGHHGGRRLPAARPRVRPRRPAATAPLPDPGWMPAAGRHPGGRSGPTPRERGARRRLGAQPAGRAGATRPARAQPGPASRPDRDAPPEVVVRRGDSLWAIAARHLGPDASDAEIARAWPAWFEANRQRRSATTPTCCVRVRCCAPPRRRGRECQRSARHSAEPAPAAADLARGGHPPLPPGHRGARGSQRPTSRTPWPSTSPRPPTSSSSVRSAPCATTCPTPPPGPRASPWPSSRS